MSHPGSPRSDYASFLLVVAGFFLSSCAGQNYESQLWIRSSAEYAAVTEQIYRLAYERIAGDLSTTQACPGKPTAVVMDLDETVLENMAFEYRRIRAGAEWKERDWDEWVTKHPEEAGLVPGAREFIAKAIRLKPICVCSAGGRCSNEPLTVAFISNRAASLREATKQSLRRTGVLPADGSERGFEFLLMENDADKEPRRMKVRERYDVLAYFGDQLTDFDSQFRAQTGSKDPSTRYQAFCANRAELGTRWFVIPNPSYGEWLRAINGVPAEALLNGERASGFRCPTQ